MLYTVFWCCVQVIEEMCFSGRLFARAIRSVLKKRSKPVYLIHTGTVISCTI